MDDDVSPITPTSIIPAKVPLGFVCSTLALMYFVIHISRYFSITVFFASIIIFLLVLFLLTPAMMLIMLKTENAASTLSSQDLGEALSDIGVGRYITALVISALIFAVFILFDYFWIAPYMQEKIAENLMAQLFSGKGENELSLPVIVYGYSLMGGLVFMLLAFFNHHFYATFFPREDDEDGEYGMDISDREGITATLAEHGVSAAPQAEKKAAEPLTDFSLLTDADTSNMGIETQKAFALALARADALLTSNKIDAGLELLAPFADENHDAAAYVPAYQRIYALKPQYDLLHRLIAAAARGHQPSFDLIRPELESIDPATLPADSVLPLAQFAARQQHYKTVLAITRQFAKNHPEHPQLIDNYILAARALAKIGAVDKAQQLLQQMLARFPDHAKAAQIRHTLKLLQEKT
ncbi:MAG: tol-pal system YbgF family protein [Cardiobacterium hominis]